MSHLPSNISCFYIPNINGDFTHLPEEESKHAIKALRLSKNDQILITDGKGCLYTASIQEANYKNTLLKIEEQKVISPLSYQLHIALSPLQHADRFEWFIEKAIEMGISLITPLLCHRTEKKKINNERLQKIAISALKQSRSAYLPTINPLTEFKEFVKKDKNSQKAIAICEGKRIPLKQFITDSKEKAYTVLIGPEGDFSDDEIKLAVENNYSAINLGIATLRSETAALYVTASMKYFFSNH